MTEQIEMLKQQISVYADDFASERADRERIQADRENQRNQIIDLTRENNLLQDQVLFIALNIFYVKNKINTLKTK